MRRVNFWVFQAVFMPSARELFLKSQLREYLDNGKFIVPKNENEDERKDEYEKQEMRR